MHTDIFLPRLRRFFFSGKNRRRQAAFTLVEIVIALGILTFSITALLGALSIGIHTNRESVEELEATHILQSVLAERRTRPVLDDSNLCLPRLDQNAERSSTNPVPLNGLGHVVQNLKDGKFGMVYRIKPASDNSGSDVYCAIYWPAQLPPTKAMGRVEIATKIILP